MRRYVNTKHVTNVYDVRRRINKYPTVDGFERSLTSMTHVYMH